MIKIMELTEENEQQYLDQIAELEQIALDKMKLEGREGQLFATGKQDISEYVHSEENTVIVAVNEEKKVKAATYVTQGQKPFTYNDITKYFKYGPQYTEYVKSQYQSTEEYKQDLLDIYKIKLQAFEYAKSRILQEYPEAHSITDFLNQEISENGFHEKSELREKLNRYMSACIIEKFDSETQAKYEQFYWITAQDISEEFGNRDVNYSTSAMQDYEKALNHSKPTIYEKPDFDLQKYFSANTQNAIELDTYITAPDFRNDGLAKIIVYEGIKKHIQQHFSNPKNEDIFLCSTLHRDNLSSKYVSEFFGLTDSLYVKRRKDRDREVHICKVPREKAQDYLLSISNKLAVLYGYNPSGRAISSETKRKVIAEQLKYEINEHQRLVKAKTFDKTFKSINLRFIESKSQKISKLNEQLNELSRGGNEYEEK